VTRAIGQEAQASATLTLIYGQRIRQRGTRDHEVPSLDYWLVVDTEEEQDAPCIVQFDQYVESYEQLVLSEVELRRLFNHEVQVWIREVFGWVEFESGADLVESPNRAGFYGRAVRFRFAPLRRMFINV
jgi:hypothetical protein